MIREKHPCDVTAGRLDNKIMCSSLGCWNGGIHHIYAAALGSYKSGGAKIVASLCLFHPIQKLKHMKNETWLIKVMNQS